MSRTSTELEIGKCGEYYALFDLIRQGFVAYPSDQGLPYDIVVDVDGRLLRGQVRSTLKAATRGQSREMYRFCTRIGRVYQTPLITACDFYAFVAIDRKKVAYVKTANMTNKVHPERVRQIMEFRSLDQNIQGRSYPNGTVRKLNYSMMLETYENFAEQVLGAGVVR